MKANGVVIFIALLLMTICVNAQTPDIRSLKSKTTTLSRTGSKEKPRRWTLVETEPKRLEAIDFNERSSRTDRDLPNADPGSGATNVGGTHLVTDEKRTYSILYAALSLNGDYRWLKLDVLPVRRGLGFLKDMGAMKLEEVDRMPDLPLKRITPENSLSVNRRVTTVGPEEFTVKAIAGHVYAVEIQDDRTYYRAIFRIDAIDANGDCHISWKPIPSKKIK